MGYLRAKSRLRRLRYETRLRAQSFVTIFLSEGGRFPVFFDSLLPYQMYEFSTVTTAK